MLDKAVHEKTFVEERRCVLYAMIEVVFELSSKPVGDGHAKAFLGSVDDVVWKSVLHGPAQE